MILAINYQVNQLVKHRSIFRPHQRNPISFLRTPVRGIMYGIVQNGCYLSAAQCQAVNGVLGYNWLEGLERLFVILLILLMNGEVCFVR